MDRATVVELAERVASIDASCADRAALVAAVADVARLRRWLDGRQALLAAALARTSSFPEKALADAARSSLREAERAVERAKVLGDAPAFARAIDDGLVGAAHVDAFGRALRALDGPRRQALLGQAERLALVAGATDPDEFAKTVKATVERLRADDGTDRLERQRRATRLRSWVDATDGMWRIAGAFDPVTGLALAARLAATKEALFHDQQPDTCPADPIERDHHLHALALIALTEGTRSTGAGGGFTAVLDANAPVAGQGPTVEWGIPVEIPASVLADLAGGQHIPAVIVRGGVVLHAPGQLDLGRTTRVANRAQRRALRAWYSTCAVPGCPVHYDRCKVHHVSWWRHGGRTDLANLVPVCEHHHHKIHDEGWTIEVAADRTLTLRLPDGQVLTTGPPRRPAA